MKIAVFAAAALLSGCYFPGFYATPEGPSVTRPAMPDTTRPFDYAAAQKAVAERMNARMTLLTGLNIHFAVDMFGYPDGSREVVGDKVYTWQYAQSFPMPDGAVLGVACSIQIGTDLADTIKKTHWEGNGCGHYANMK